MMGKHPNQFFEDVNFYHHKTFTMGLQKINWSKFKFTLITSFGSKWLSGYFLKLGTVALNILKKVAIV